MPQSDDTPQERPPLTDEVELFFQRLGLGEAEKEEIEDQTGLNSEDLRPALAYLEGEGKIEGTDVGWRAKDPEGAEPPPAPAGAPEEGGEERGDTDLSSLIDEPGPAVNAHVRMRSAVVCSFGRKPGDSDEGAILKAQLLTEEFGNAIAAAFPKLDFHVELQGVDSFDNPRPLFPAPDDQ